MIGVDVVARLVVGGCGYAITNAGLKIIVDKVLEEVTLTTAEKVCVGAAKLVTTGIVGNAAYQLFTGGGSLGNDISTLYNQIKNKDNKEEVSKDGNTPESDIEPAAA